MVSTCPSGGGGIDILGSGCEGSGGVGVRVGKGKSWGGGRRALEERSQDVGRRGAAGCGGGPGGASGPAPSPCRPCSRASLWSGIGLRRCLPPSLPLSLLRSRSPPSGAAPSHPGLGSLLVPGSRPVARGRGTRPARHGWAGGGPPLLRPLGPVGGRGAVWRLRLPIFSSPRGTWLQPPPTPHPGKVPGGRAPA